MVKAVSPIEAYLSARRGYGIRRAATPETLETFVGKRVLELRGTVRGLVRVGESTTLMLGTGEDAGDELTVEAKSVPVWLTGDVPVRLIVQATRTSDLALPHFRLVVAAPEDAVAAAEAREPAPKPATKSAVVAKAPAKKAAPKRGTTTSRAGNGRSGRQWYLPASQVLPHYVAFVQKANPRLSRAEADRIARGLVGFSLKYGVDARLIVAIVMCESEFNPNSTSHAGAGGLGQLMPETARGLGVRNRYDTTENLYGTVKLMRSNLDLYAKSHAPDRALTLAIAGYNAGNGAVRKYGGVPPYKETQRYVQKVLATYRKLCGA